jgi:hypothetical protein
MAIPTFNAVGFCAHYSDQGDWAFDYALRLSKLHELQLNVFHFLSDPYSAEEDITEKMWPDERKRLAIQKEKELRMYYDKRAGDYLDVGFRLCEDAEWTELHRCLLVQEFQVLVLGYIEKGIKFGQFPIEEFAEKFISPVILIGPKGPNQIYLNSRAVLLADRVAFEGIPWKELSYNKSNIKA